MNVKKLLNSLYMVILITCMLSIKQSLIIAQTEQDYASVKNANKAYSDGKYQEAADLYEKVLKNNLSASELYFNLGNSYYRLGDYKRAILNYERAKLIDPDHENILINLEFAQRYVQDKIEIVPRFVLIRWFHAFIDIFSANIWAFISIATFILFLCLAILILFSKSFMLRKFSFYIGFFSIFISLISFYCAFKQNQKITSHNTAIVFSPAVTVKSSPNENGTDLFIIHEGLKVTITDKSPGWKEIRLSDGKIGWLPENAIETI